MTIYGEWNERFRPRPKNWALFLFCTAFLLMAVELSGLVTSVVHVAATESRALDGAFPLYAPFAQKVVIFRAGPHAAALREVIAPIADLVLATLLLTVVPTSTTLASRLAVHLAALAFALQPVARALEVSPAQWLEGELSIGGVWRPATLIAALLLFHFSEARRNELMSNVEPLFAPARRVRLWSLSILAPLLLVAAIAFVAHYPPLAIGAVIAIAMTLLTNLSTRPGEGYEKLEGIELREGAATIPVVALLVIALSVFLFGFPNLGRQNRAVMIGGKSFLRVTPAADIHILTAADEVEQKKAEERERRKKSVIDIRWSRGKSAPTTTAPSPNTATTETAGGTQ